MIGRAAEDLRQTRATLVFGFAGLTSGLALKLIASGKPLSFAKLSPSFYFFLLVAGALFLLALTLSFAICRHLQWIRVRISTGRLLMAAVLTSSSSLGGGSAGLFAGITMASLMAQPVTLAAGRVVNPPHQSFYTAIMVTSALTFGLLVGVALVSLALYVATQDLNLVAWRYMMLGIVGIVALTMLAHPRFVGIARPYAAQPNSLDELEQAMLSLHVWGHSLLGACAGYWLAGSE